MKIKSISLSLAIIYYAAGIHASDIYIYTKVPSSKKIVIGRVNNNLLGSAEFPKKTTPLDNGEFSASLKGKDPLYCFFQINDTIYTEPFFLDPTAPRIEITVNLDQSVTIRNSKVQDEYKKSFTPMMDRVNKEISDFFSGEYRATYVKYNGQLPDTVALRFESTRSGLREKRFTAIHDYIASNRASYVAMYKLLDEVLVYGYSDKLAEGYKLFSNDAKKFIDRSGREC
jgi:hypothetical protein